MAARLLVDDEVVVDESKSIHTWKSTAWADIFDILYTYISAHISIYLMYDILYYIYIIYYTCTFDMYGRSITGGWWGRCRREQNHTRMEAGARGCLPGGFTHRNYSAPLPACFCCTGALPACLTTFTRPWDGRMSHISSRLRVILLRVTYFLHAWNPQRVMSEHKDSAVTIMLCVWRGDAVLCVWRGNVVLCVTRGDVFLFVMTAQDSPSPSTFTIICLLHSFPLDPQDAFSKSNAKCVFVMWTDRPAFT